jgi:transglutaminase-like putative cysteine protease
VRARIDKLAIVLLLIIPALAGCGFKDWVDDNLGPSAPVARTELHDGQVLRQRIFQVVVQQEQALPVRIVATEAASGEQLVAQGLSRLGEPVTLELQDGTWTITYYVDGQKRETFRSIVVDATPPTVTGLQRVGDAVGGSFVIGAGATTDADVVRVLDLQTGRVVADAIPATLGGLTGDRLYVYMVAFGDRAGNWANFTVQVRSGSASTLPAQGSYTFGVMARYENEVRIWDLRDLDAYLTPAQARAEVGQKYLGSGYQITPNDPLVRDVVEQVVKPGSPEHSSTAEIALALFVWLYDTLEYTESRLEATDLQSPAKTMQSGGGVCRDLAALYVSLLRAAGVPARLVSGYLAGNVNGFHAWVEFYGGSVAGMEAWVPVDVSPIDGPYDARGTLNAFGVQQPEYLTLRVLDEEAEKLEGWSTALSVRYEYYGNPPTVNFENHVRAVGVDEVGVLCANEQTLDRMVAENPQQCDASRFPQHRHLPGFVRFTVRQIDYGIALVDYTRGTTITAEISYPFTASVVPNSVEYVVYGDERFVKQWTPDPAHGVMRTSFTV